MCVLKLVCMEGGGRGLPGEKVRLSLSTGRSRGSGCLFLSLRDLWSSLLLVGG